MAISDIPEFVEVAPGDMIRAENWNDVQRKLRDSLRRHKHTRAPNSQPDDAGTSDDAAQIGTNELADGAVTAAKLAAGVISTSTIPNGAITQPKLAEGAVSTGKLANGAVTTDKISPSAINASRLAFSVLADGSEALTAGQTKDITVTSVPSNAKSGIYFPVLTILSTTTPGTAMLDANILYTRGNTDDEFFVRLRLRNIGNATAGVIWQVLTFAS